MFVYGFGLGTFKYLFAHWIMVETYERGLKTSDYSFVDIFLPTYLGAIVTMSVFFWGSEYFMKRAAKKKIDAKLLAEQNGLEFVPKKNFTRINKLLVKVRQSLGIYGLTFLAPLFLSIPGGSVVCAKFFGHKRETFPLMIVFTAIYGSGMTFLTLAMYD